MLLNNFGSIAGVIYQHMGRTFFVAPAASYTIGGRTYVASDANDGLSPDRALLTVTQAQSLAAASVGDVICLLPGDHTVTASIAASKAGITYTGLPRARGKMFGNGTTLTISADDQIMNVTAANIEVCHLTLIPVTTKAAIDLTAAGDRLYVHDCYFDMATAAASTSTLGIDSAGAAEQVLIENCYFLSDGAQGPAIDTTALIDSVVRDCVIANNGGTWAVGVLCGAATENVLFDNCRFLCTGTAMTAGISGTGATIASGVIVMNCRFSSLVTVPVDNFDAGEAELSETYDAGVGATDGGVLIVAIT